jgi:hypothetical protein
MGRFYRYEVPVKVILVVAEEDPEVESQAEDRAVRIVREKLQPDRYLAGYRVQSVLSGEARQKGDGEI